jgi:S1-C subfamily serine protease
MLRRSITGLIALLLILGVGGIASAQDNTGLTAQDIARIGQSVVYIETFQRGQPYSFGSGTIVDPSGIIYTNTHVIADADDYRISITREVGELPEVIGYASVVQNFSPAGIDFAILQIDRDPNRRPVDPLALNLPALESAARETALGERIWVFGYPGVGDGYLVVTQGSITSVENANITGQRVPAWYRTDAEISPGNSGGLVVNGRGEFLGIPTMVRSEERTLGRLGGVLPFIAVETVLTAFEGGAVAITTPVPPTNVRQSLSITISDVEYDVAVENGGPLGIKFYTDITATGYNGRDIRAAIFLYNADNTPVSCQNMSEEYCDPNGGITVQAVLTPSFDDTIWEDYWFWIPYEGFPSGLTGSVNFNAQANVGLNGGGVLTNPSALQAFRINFGSSTSRPNTTSADFTIEITSQEYNVAGDHSSDAGVRTYLNFTANNAKGRGVRVALYFYDSSGALLKCDRAFDSYYCDPNGNLTVQEVVTPSYDSSQWNDYWMHVPFGAFPSGPRGTVPVSVKALIDLDGGSGFNFGSELFEFELYY